MSKHVSKAERSTGANDTPEATTANSETEGVPSIHVYEPALCCNTGVCGPDVDPALVAFTADLAHLVDQGVKITRHNLANDPTAFTSSEPVRKFLHVAGSEGLPRTTVDGVTVMTGSYPTRAQLTRYAGLDQEPVVPASATTLALSDEDGCGCGSGGCC